jgi:hypothetical protein
MSNEYFFLHYSHTKIYQYDDKFKIIYNLQFTIYN